MYNNLIVRGGITKGELFLNEDIVFGQGLIDAVSLESKAEYPCVVASEKLKNALSDLLHDISESYQKIRDIIQKKTEGTPVSKESENYLSQNMERVVKELYYTRSLQELLRNFDKEEAFINYLYDLSFKRLFGYKFAEYFEAVAAKSPEKYQGVVEVREDYDGVLLAHKNVVIKKLKEYCNYNGLDKTNQNTIFQREKIIRKYVWLLRYHCSICMERNFPRGLFVHKIGYDPNVLRLIVEVEE